MTRGERRFAVGLFLGALLLRLLHMSFEAGSLFFDEPAGGERAMLELAARLAAGHGWGEAAFSRPPLYPYLLAGTTAAAGGALWLARLAQAFLDAGSCVLAFAIARDIFDRRTAYIAGVATALNGALIYFTARLSPASLAVFLGLGVLWLLLRAARTGRAGGWLAAGAAVGLAALNRSEMLALIPVAVAFAALSGDTWRRRAAAAGLVAAAALACIAPVTAHNAGAGAGFTPISTDGGIRLYTGTSPTYRGIIGPLAGRDTEELVRAPAKLGVDTEAGRSRYYTRRAFELMSSRPSRYAGLVASKLYMFWHGHELAGDYDLYAARRDSPVLATLLYHSVVLYFPFGLLAPLGLLGIAIAWRRSGARLLAAFVAVQLTGAVLFVVTAGLRLPAVAVLGIFAAAGAVWLYDRAHEPARRRQLVIAACAVAALYGAINVPYPFAGRRTEYAIRMAADRLHTRGVALYQRGESLEAAKTLHRSVALHPTALSLRDYAKSLIVIGRNAEGIEALVQSIELATGDIGAEHWIPANGELIARLRDVVPRPADLADWEVFFQGHACYRRHKWDCAIPAFEQVISESSEETGLHTSAEFLYARSIAGEGMDMAAQHRYKSAIRKLHRAQALGAGNIETRLLLALSYLRRKNTLIARHEFLTCRFTEIPAGAFFHLLARPDNDIEGALGFTVVTGYLSLIPDDPLAIAAQDIIQAHWRTKEGLQPK